MPEEMLCLAGKYPKLLGFIDFTKGQYVNLIIKLKEDITELEIRDFFNTLYHAKLDGTYSQTLTSGYSTSDLRLALKDIMTEKNVINLKKIYEIANKESEISKYSLQLVIERFFSMFEVVDEEKTFTIEEYNEMVRNLNTNPLFKNQESNFRKEAEACFYNSYFLNEKNILFNKQIMKPKKKVFVLEKAVS